MEKSRFSSISSYTQHEIEHPLCAKCDVPMWLLELSLIFRITTSERLNAKRAVAPRR